MCVDFEMMVLNDAAASGGRKTVRKWKNRVATERLKIMILNKNNFYKHTFLKFFTILFENIINGLFQYYVRKTISLR